jgi:hypothetical protein
MTSSRLSMREIGPSRLGLGWGLVGIFWGRAEHYLGQDVERLKKHT